MAFDADHSILEAMKVIWCRREEAFNLKMRHTSQEMAEKEQELSLIKSREDVYKGQIESMNKESADIAGEHARLAAETKTQEAMITNLNLKLRESSQHFETADIESKRVAEQLQSKVDEYDQVVAENANLKEQVLGLTKDKKNLEIETAAMRTEMDIMQKGSNCACTIS